MLGHSLPTWMSNRCAYSNFFNCHRCWFSSSRIFLCNGHNVSHEYLNIIVRTVPRHISIPFAYRTSRFAFPENRAGSSIGFLLMFCNFFLMMALCGFLLVWFFVGCVWVFQVKTLVDYYDSASKNYCHPVLYLFTFTTLAIAVCASFIFTCKSIVTRQPKKQTNTTVM